MRVGWIDASCGISGDMLLGACVDAGVGIDVLQDSVDRLELPEPVHFRAEEAMRGGLGGTRVVVEVAETDRTRGLGDVLALLERADPAVREPAGRVFDALARAEARVHRVDVEEVHFHEVGALDSIADVVGVVAAMIRLGCDRLVCSPVALGGGRARSGHGPVPVPGPAVLELLHQHGVPGAGGPVEVELATPTGVALVALLADEFGPMPALIPESVGHGVGSRDLPDHPNLTRLVVGQARVGATTVPAVVLEANVDDLDPRLWPPVLAALLDAGASDAWLTPILMKKGRPAHTLSVLAAPDRADALERLVLTQTSTIGVRRHRVDKHALPRESVAVLVHGEQVRVKVARLGDRVVNAEPEYDDVAAVAASLGLPAKQVLEAARRQAHRLLED